MPGVAMSLALWHLTLAGLLIAGWVVLHVNGVSLLTNRSIGQYWRDDGFKVSRAFLLASLVACALAIYSPALGAGASFILFLLYTLFAVRRR